MSALDKNQLAKEVFKVAHLRGEFKLRSGQISNEYFDKYQFESNPKLLSQIASGLKSFIPKGTELLGALEMGGIPIATALSLETGIPIVFVRKEAKDYGTCRFAEGPAIKGKKVCLIEDVITTGGQVLISTADLRAEGAVIDTVLCVIDRSGGKTEKIKEAGLTHKALFTMDELKSAGGLS
jgi:orotate phosphoribosyltransferase